ncbi:GNAT family N-acetyltransferase [soil metagenome]
MPVGQADIGRRVVVRYALDGGSATDVIGRLLAYESGALRVERRDGSPVDVPLDRVLHSKVVPARPTRSRRAEVIDPEVLMRITSRGWPAVISEPLGDWELRAAGGFTGRANSVAVHGEPGVEVYAALAAVEAFYDAQGLPPRAQVIEGGRWNAALAAAGWMPQGGDLGGAVVLVAELVAGSSADAGPADVSATATVAHTASDEWLALYHRAAEPAVARAVLEATPTVGFVSIGSPIVAIGRVAVTGEWAGLACVEVVEARRRKGLGRQIVEASITWALEHGADKAYLQTTPGNAAALALYAPYGFAEHHRYRYLTPTERR